MDGFRKRRYFWLVAAMAIAVLVTLGLLYWSYRDQLPSPEVMRNHLLAFLEAIPAPLYFLALVVLPAFGAPLTVFYLTALPVLGNSHPAFGILIVWLALALNMVLSRWLALSFLHPMVEWMLRHRNLRIPRISRENELQIVLMLRISPLPFVLQNYLLALGKARWRNYLCFSLLIQGPIGLAMMLVGNSLLSGRLGYVLLALFLFLALNLAMKFIRKRLRRDPAEPLT